MVIRIYLFLIAFTFSTNIALAQKPGDNLLGENDITAEQLYKVMPGDIIIGNEEAPVTIIEYASMSCSHCASFHNNTFPQLKEKFINTGKARFIFRDFPLDEPALRASMMARCAGKDSSDKFLQFIKVIFSTQSNWAPKKNYLEVLSNIGKLGGMRGEEFDVCIADQELEHSIIKTKFQASKQLEVRSTPTFFVNNQMHKGAKNTKYFSDLINDLLPEDNTQNTEQ